MTLTLTITKHPELPRGTALSRSFDRCNAVIGRGAESDWQLPDPERHLSKLHCEIVFRGDRYYIVDKSKNGVFLNESIEPLRQGNMAELHDGDRLALGDYELQIRLSSAERSFAAPEPMQRSDRIPDDFDPFGDSPLAPPDPSLGDRGAPVEVHGEMFLQDTDPGADPIAELAGPENTPLGGRSAIPDDIDLVTGLPRAAAHEGPAQKDDAAPEQAYFRPPNPVRSPIPDDWDADPATVEPAPKVAQRAAKEPARTAAPQTTRPAAEASGLLQVFLEGAGLDEASLSDADPETVMHAVGQMFREMVAGLRETLMSRTAFKSEFRIERTMIRQSENNPLKFSISADEALLALLRRTGPGYLPPVEAVRQGVEDVKAHQLAVVAGLQVALIALLGEFDPEKLKQRLEQQRSVVSSLLPGAKNAKAWEIYEAFYKEAAAEAEQGFDGLFGRAFRRAYEEQLKKL